MKRKVPDILNDLGDLYRERNSVYGDDYKRHGTIMTALFPDGVELKTVSDFNRYSAIKEVVTKLSRYARTFKHGGHIDSVNDLIVYGAMLKELDDEHQDTNF